MPCAAASCLMLAIKAAKPPGSRQVAAVGGAGGKAERRQANTARPKGATLIASQSAPSTKIRDDGITLWRGSDFPVKAWRRGGKWKSRRGSAGNACGARADAGGMRPEARRATRRDAAMRTLASDLCRRAGGVALRRPAARRRQRALRAAAACPARRRARRHHGRRAAAPHQTVGGDRGRNFPRPVRGDSRWARASPTRRCSIATSRSST